MRVERRYEWEFSPIWYICKALADKMNDIAITIILRWTEFRLLTRQLNKQINIYDWFSSLSGISSFEYFYWISIDKRTLSIYTWVGFFVICDFFLLSHKYTIGWNMQSNVNMFNTCHTIELFFFKKKLNWKTFKWYKEFSFFYICTIEVLIIILCFVQMTNMDLNLRV